MQRTVLLTGASRGIGRSIARRLLKDGHRLSLGLRDPQALRGTDLDVETVLHHAYDASDPTSVEAWVDSTVRHWGATSPDLFSKISGYGYAWGYFGGGLLFLVNALMSLYPEMFGLSVSLEIFLLIDVNFSNLRTAVAARGFKSSSLLLFTCLYGL